jgi:hypothetical protein
VRHRDLTNRSRYATIFGYASRPGRPCSRPVARGDAYLAGTSWQSTKRLSCRVSRPESGDVAKTRRP